MTDTDRHRAVTKMNATRDTRHRVNREVRDTVAALMVLTTTDLITDREKWTSIADTLRDAASTIDRHATEHDELTQ